MSDQLFNQTWDLLPIRRTEHGYVQATQYCNADLYHEEVEELDASSLWAPKFDTGTAVLSYLLVGDQNAGKSTFLHTFTHGQGRNFLMLSNFFPILSSVFVNTRLIGEGRQYMDQPPFLDTDIARASVLLSVDAFRFFLNEQGLPFVKGNILYTANDKSYPIQDLKNLTNAVSKVPSSISPNKTSGNDDARNNQPKLTKDAIVELESFHRSLWMPDDDTRFVSLTMVELGGDHLDRVMQADMVRKRKKGSNDNNTLDKAHREEAVAKHGEAIGGKGLAGSDVGDAGSEDSIDEHLHRVLDHSRTLLKTTSQMIYMVNLDSLLTITKRDDGNEHDHMFGATICSLKPDQLGKLVRRIVYIASLRADDVKDKVKQATSHLEAGAEETAKPENARVEKKVENEEAVSALSPQANQGGDTLTGLPDRHFVSLLLSRGWRFDYRGEDWLDREMQTGDFKIVDEANDTETHSKDGECNTADQANIDGNGDSTPTLCSPPSTSSADPSMASPSSSSLQLTFPPSSDVPAPPPSPVILIDLDNSLNALRSAINLLLTKHQKYPSMPGDTSVHACSSDVDVTPSPSSTKPPSLLPLLDNIPSWSARIDQLLTYTINQCVSCALPAHLSTSTTTTSSTTTPTTTSSSPITATEANFSSAASNRFIPPPSIHPSTRRAINLLAKSCIPSTSLIAGPIPSPSPCASSISPPQLPSSIFVPISQFLNVSLAIILDSIPLLSSSSSLPSTRQPSLPSPSIPSSSESSSVVRSNTLTYLLGIAEVRHANHVVSQPRQSSRISPISPSIPSTSPIASPSTSATSLLDHSIAPTSPLEPCVPAILSTLRHLLLRGMHMHISPPYSQALSVLLNCFKDVSSRVNEYGDMDLYITQERFNEYLSNHDDHCGAGHGNHEMHDMDQPEGNEFTRACTQSDGEGDEDSNLDTNPNLDHCLDTDEVDMSYAAVSTHALLRLYPTVVRGLIRGGLCLSYCDINTNMNDAMAQVLTPQIDNQIEGDTNDASMKTDLEEGVNSHVNFYDEDIQEDNEDTYQNGSDDDFPSLIAAYTPDSPPNSFANCCFILQLASMPCHGDGNEKGTFKTLIWSPIWLKYIVARKATQHFKQEGHRESESGNGCTLNADMVSGDNSSLGPIDDPPMALSTILKCCEVYSLEMGETERGGLPSREALLKVNAKIYRIATLSGRSSVFNDEEGSHDSQLRLEGERLDDQEVRITDTVNEKTSQLGEKRRLGDAPVVRLTYQSKLFDTLFGFAKPSIGGDLWDISKIRPKSTDRRDNDSRLTESNDVSNDATLDEEWEDGEIIVRLPGICTCDNVDNSSTQENKDIDQGNKPGSNVNVGVRGCRSPSRANDAMGRQNELGRVHAPDCQYQVIMNDLEERINSTWMKLLREAMTGCHDTRADDETEGTGGGGGDGDGDGDEGKQSSHYGDIERGSCTQGGWYIDGNVVPSLSHVHTSLILLLEEAHLTLKACNPHPSGTLRGPERPLSLDLSLSNPGVTMNVVERALKRAGWIEVIDDHMNSNGVLTLGQEDIVHRQEGGECMKNNKPTVQIRLRIS